jgi:deoxycytidine triphosphate deaminase
VVLSDRSIKQQIEAGRLVFEPFDPAAIQPASVDLRLDRSFRVFRNARRAYIDVRQPMEDLTELVEIDADDPFILHPGEFVLGSTLEHVTLPDDLVARVEGKALALDTLVPTPVGWTTMGQVQAGDEVLDNQGRPCTVLRVSPIFLGDECFQISFDDRTSVIADAGHRWVTWDKAARSSQAKRSRRLACGLRINGEACPAVRTTRELLSTLLASDGERNHAIDVASVNLPPIDLPIDPYILGAWLGDGTTTQATITIGREDQQHFRDQFAVAGVSLGRRSKDTYFSIGNAAEGRNSHRNEKGQYIADGSMKCLLRDLGVLGGKHIPVRYLRASAEQRLALLQGVMDADGHLNRDDQAEITLTNQRLADDVAELIASLGIKVWRDERPAKLYGRECGTAYRSRFRPLLPVFRLARKAGRIRHDVSQTSELRRRFIRVVTPVPSQPVRCIEVDSPGQQFLITRSFIPTHNSSLGRLGLLVHATAGYVDPGWAGQLTLELSNVATLPITLYYRMKIGQLSFHQMTTPVDRPYGSPELGSKYQGQRLPTASRAYQDFRP